MSQITRFGALSPTNQFQFQCPIFNVDVKMRQCVALNEAVKINKQPDVRKGCQACIRSGKCPVDVMGRMISFGNPGVEPDDYAAATPTKGKLHPNLLKRIAPVMVQERTLTEMSVPDVERDLILKSHQRMMSELPKYETEDTERTAAPKRKRASKPKPAETTPAPITRVNKAAETGDLAAAL